MELGGEGQKAGNEDLIEKKCREKRDLI